MTNSIYKISAIQKKMRDLIDDLENLKLNLTKKEQRNKIDEEALGIKSHMQDIVESFTNAKKEGQI